MPRAGLAIQAITADRDRTQTNESECRGRDSNPHATIVTPDFKSGLSTDSSTSACAQILLDASIQLYQTRVYEINIYLP